MNVARMCGKAIVMIIPTFVGAGVVWELFHNYVAVGIWVVIVALVSAATVFRKDLEELKSYLPKL